MLIDNLHVPSIDCVTDSSQNYNMTTPLGALAHFRERIAPYDIISLETHQVSWSVTYIFPTPKQYDIRVLSVLSSP